MKKRLEAELLSIAHRILKLKNKSEVDQLYHESQKLYEALAVLKFYGDNYEQIKSDVSYEDIEDKLTTSIEEKEIEVTHKLSKEINEPAFEEVKEEVLADEKTEEIHVETVIEADEEVIVETEDSIVEENIIEEIIAEEKSDFETAPIFELAADSPSDEVIEETIQETKQISFDDLLGENYTEPVFVKPNEVTKTTSKKAHKETKLDVIVESTEEKALSLNDKFAKTINIGLNDRMGFVKHLFADSSEDYNRVLSQLNTFSSFEEARDFIEEIIKPDYDNWESVSDYAERFIEIVEKKFL